MRSIVVDASALLAFIENELGSEVVQESLDLYVMSAVNHAEILSKLEEFKVFKGDTRQPFNDLSIPVIAFNKDQSVLAAKLRPQTRHVGLSLGDRACLALAQYLGVPAMTADKSWASCDLPIEIILIR